MTRKIKDQIALLDHAGDVKGIHQGALGACQTGSDGLRLMAVRAARYGEAMLLRVLRRKADAGIVLGMHIHALNAVNGVSGSKHHAFAEGVRLKDHVAIGLGTLVEFLNAVRDERDEVGQILGGNAVDQIIVGVLGKADLHAEKNAKSRALGGLLRQLKVTEVFLGTLLGVSRHPLGIEVVGDGQRVTFEGTIGLHQLPRGHVRAGADGRGVGVKLGFVGVGGNQPFVCGHGKSSCFILVGN